MASNKDLIEKILGLSPDADIKGMNNADLSAKLKELNAGEGDEGDDTPELPPVKASGAEFVIAKGKALTVQNKGILKEGDEIKAKWLPGGEDQLAALIAKKYVE